MKPLNLLLVSLIIEIVTSQTLFAESIQVITERSPFTSSKQSSVDGGEATEFVRRVLEQSGLSYKLSYQPWKRAYNTALTKKNVLVYPLARSKPRESMFIWVGELIPVNYYLVKLKSRTEIKIQTLEDAKNYRIGVVNFHVTHEYFIKNKFKNLQPVNSNIQNLRKTQLNRIDLFPISDGGLLSLCKKYDLDCNQFEPVIKLEEISEGLYLAFSKNTDNTLLKKVDQGFKDLVANGEHASLFKERIEDIRLYNKIWPQKEQLTNSP